MTVEDVIAAAQDQEGPLARSFCLFSGGHDSTVLAHRCRDFYDELAFIDTGTALPGVRDFVERFAGQLEKPLRVYEAGDAYRKLVLGGDRFWQAYGEHGSGLTVEQWIAYLRTMPQARALPLGRAEAPMGFPGPAGHRYCYQRLKERQIRQLVRETKAALGDRTARVGLLSGVRIQESQRRKMNAFVPVEREGAQVWISPLLEWGRQSMDAYRREHQLPESDVAALIHRSGECNCGAYAAPGERGMIRDLFPEWWKATIQPIEDAAEALGLTRCRWGDREIDQNLRDRGRRAPGPMCSDCQLDLEEEINAIA